MTTSVMVIGRRFLSEALKENDPNLTEPLFVAVPRYPTEVDRAGDGLLVEDRSILFADLERQLREFSGRTTNPVVNSLQRWFTKTENKRAVLVDVRGVSDAVSCLLAAANSVRGTSTAVIAVQPEIGLDGEGKSALLRAGADLIIDPAEARSATTLKLTESYVEATEAEKRVDRQVEWTLIWNSILLSFILGLGSGLTSAMVKNVLIQEGDRATLPGWTCDVNSVTPSGITQTVIKNHTDAPLEISIVSSFQDAERIVLSPQEARPITFGPIDRQDEQWLRVLGLGCHSSFHWAAAREIPNSTSPEARPKPPDSLGQALGNMSSHLD